MGRSSKPSERKARLSGKNRIHPNPRRKREGRQAVKKRLRSKPRKRTKPLRKLPRITKSETLDGQDNINEMASNRNASVQPPSPNHFTGDEELGVLNSSGNLIHKDPMDDRFPSSRPTIQARSYAIAEGKAYLVSDLQRLSPNPSFVKHNLMARTVSYNDIHTLSTERAKELPFDEFDVLVVEEIQDLALEEFMASNDDYLKLLNDYEISSNTYKAPRQQRYKWRLVTIFHVLILFRNEIGRNPSKEEGEMKIRETWIAFYTGILKHDDSEFPRGWPLIEIPNYHPAIAIEFLTPQGSTPRKPKIGPGMALSTSLSSKEFLTVFKFYGYSNGCACVPCARDMCLLKRVYVTYVIKTLTLCISAKLDKTRCEFRAW